MSQNFTVLRTWSPWEEFTRSLSAIFKLDSYICHGTSGPRLVSFIWWSCFCVCTVNILLIPFPLIPPPSPWGFPDVGFVGTPLAFFFLSNFGNFWVFNNENYPFANDFWWPFLSNPTKSIKIVRKYRRKQKKRAFFVKVKQNRDTFEY